MTVLILLPRAFCRQYHLDLQHQQALFSNILNFKDSFYCLLYAVRLLHACNHVCLKS